MAGWSTSTTSRSCGRPAPTRRACCCARCTWAAWTSSHRRSRCTASAARHADDTTYGRLYDHLKAVRARHGLTLIGWRNLRGLFKALRAGENLVLFCDGGYRPGDVPVEFLGEPTTFPTGPATLSARSGAPMLPVACYRTTGDRFTARGLPLIRAAARSRPRSSAPPRPWPTSWATVIAADPGSGTCSGRSGRRPRKRASRHGPLSRRPGAARTGPGRRPVRPMRGMALRLGLQVADAVARSLPRGAAYALADLGGRAWYRLAPSVARWWPRTCRAWRPPPAAPTTERAMRRMVQRAFVNHARYWLEMLRSPYYPARTSPRSFMSTTGSAGSRCCAAAVIALPHLATSSRMATSSCARPARRGAGRGDRSARALRLPARPPRQRKGVGGAAPPLVRPMLSALRRGELVALIADRDLPATACRSACSAAPTTLPAPATLALRTERPLMMARVLRTAPERFSVRAELVEAPRTGQVDQDVAPSPWRWRRASRRPSARRRTSGGRPSSRSGPISARARRKRETLAAAAARQGGHAPAHPVLGRDRRRRGAAPAHRDADRPGPGGDHRSRAPGRRAARPRDPCRGDFHFELVVGEEITTRRGHLLALFIEERIPPCGRCPRRWSASTSRAAWPSPPTRWRR